MQLENEKPNTLDLGNLGKEFNELLKDAIIAFKEFEVALSGIKQPAMDTAEASSKLREILIELQNKESVRITKNIKQQNELRSRYCKNKNIK